MKVDWHMVLLVMAAILVVKVMGACPPEYTGPCQHCIVSEKYGITVSCKALEVKALPPLPYPPEQIRTLYLYYKDLHVIRDHFLEGAAGIKELGMSYNNLTDLSLASFYEVSWELERLDLSYNSLDKFDLQALGHLKLLTYLDLRHNKITSLAPFDFTFKNNPNLKTLMLNGNDLSSPDALPAGVFAELSQLTDLFLSESNISHLEPLVATGKLEALNDLRLFDNNIKTIDSCVLSVVSHLRIFDVRWNPLHCDCHLLWLWDWYNNHPEKNYALFKGHFNAATCASPVHLEGRVISEMPREELEGPGCEEDLGENKCLQPHQDV